MAGSKRIARLSLLTTAGLVVMTTSAWGYVRKVTDGGIPEYWQVSCIPLTIYTYSFTDMTRDEVAKSVGAAAHTWSPAAVTCADGVSHPFLEIIPSLAPEGSVPPKPAYDGHNTLVFFTQVNLPPPLNPIGMANGVVALTATWARADGHIVDADVQINALELQWANRDPGYVPPDRFDPYDLQNATTHELGHLQGLGHSCWNIFSDFDQPIDDHGAGVPTCSLSAPADVRATVMYANIDSTAEISKRQLSPDDIRAVCEIYPSSSNQYTCTSDMPDDGCGCGTASAAGRTAPVGASLGVFAFMSAALALRGRRAGRSAPARSPRARRADRE